jgi:hypothetical protein
MTRSFARFRWPALLLLAPPAAAVVYVAMFATATPLTDEWIMLGSAVDLHKHGWSLHALRSIQIQHQQHLLIVPYLIYFPLEELFRFDTRALVAVTLICFAVQLAVFRFQLVKDDLAAFPIALLLFSPSHYMEFHWGFQFALALSVTFPVVALAVLDHIGDDLTGVSIRHYVIGTVLLVLGALSSAPGYFGFLSAVVLITLKTLPTRTKIVLSLSWVLIAAVIYFGIASRWHSGHILGVREIFYVLTALGSVIWGSPVGTFKFGIDRDSLTGLALIVALIAVLARIRPRFSLLALPIALISLGLGTIAAVGVSRLYLGNWHLQLALPAVCGIYAAAYIVWRRERSRFNTILFSGVVLLLLLNLDGSYLGFTEFGPSYRNYVSKIEDYILSYTPSLEKPFPHPGDRDIDAEMIEFLREKHHPLFEAQRRH